MAEVIELRPEVLELVREIAKRPDSVLLRVKPGTELRELSEDRSWVTGAESGLSRAERELVDLYREEVAFALRQVAWAILCDLSTVQGRMIRRLSVESEAASVGLRAAAIAATHVAADESAMAAVEGIARSLLKMCADPNANAGMHVPRLCSAANRLRPSFRARHHAAIFYMLQSRRQPALMTARHGLSTAQNGLEQAASWTVIAEVAAQAQMWERSHAASGRATRAQPELLSPYVTAAWSAIQMVDEHRAHDALRELSRLVDGHADALAEHRARFTAMRVVFRDSLSAESWTTLRRMKAGPLAVTQELFHAID